MDNQFYFINKRNCYSLCTLHVKMAHCPDSREDDGGILTLRSLQVGHLEILGVKGE
jgi:hypothetical protein